MMQEKLDQADFKAACLERETTEIKFVGNVDDYTRHLEEEVEHLKDQLRSAWSRWDRGKKDIRLASLSFQ